jgi:hypothetical protein
MGIEDRYRTAKQQEEVTQLAMAVTRAIATLIHADEFLQRVHIVMKKSTDEAGILNLTEESAANIMSAINLFGALQNGLYSQQPPSQLMQDIILISKYNEFGFEEYITKMHEMINTDENKETQKQEPDETILPSSSAVN